MNRQEVLRGRQRLKSCPIIKYNSPKISLFLLYLLHHLGHTCDDVNYPWQQFIISYNFVFISRKRKYSKKARRLNEVR